MIYGVLTKLEDVTDVHKEIGKIIPGTVRKGPVIMYPKVGEPVLVGSLYTTNVESIESIDPYHAIFTTKNSKYLLNTDTEFLEFFESGAKELDIQMQPVKTIEKRLTTLGWKEDEPFGEKTNGWQIDFLHNFYKGDEKVTLRGSLFNGEFKLVRENVSNS